MLLTLCFHGLRLRAGVRVGDVYEDDRCEAGRSARIYGWSYRTLEGHFEQGEMAYEVWKWRDTGEVEFHIHAVSRPARCAPAMARPAPAVQATSALRHCAAAPWSATTV